MHWVVLTLVLALAIGLLLSNNFSWVSHGWVGIIFLASAVCLSDMRSYSSLLESVDSSSSWILLLSLVWASSLFSWFSSSVLVCVVFGVLVICWSTTWVGVYLGLELVSLGVVVLIGSDRNSLMNVEAMVKYFVISATSGSFFLMGVLNFYWSTGSLFLVDTVEGLGSYLIIFSLLLKLGVWPAYGWYLDIQEGCNSKLVLAIVTLPKLGIYSILLLLDCTIEWFLLCFFFNLCVGLLGLLGEAKLSSFIGYSSMVVESLTLLGLWYGLPINLYFYLTFYFLSLSLLWTISESDSLNDSYYGGYALDGLIILWSIGGVPPLVGFFTKWWLLRDIWANGSEFLVYIFLGSTFFLIFLYSAWALLIVEQSLSMWNSLSSWSVPNYDAYLILFLSLGVFLF